jgi:DNA-binding LytR/AlgR family response regulator
MRKVTCMIVEDEPVSQEILHRYITDYGSLELIATCNNAIEASQKITTVSPELLFLDITMPRLSGLDFYKSLVNPPHVIFTTAYPEYAVNGFEVNAIDYLVKPFSFERFVKAMHKVQEIFGPGAKNESDFITLQADKKIYKIPLDDILHLEASGDYVKVILLTKTLIVHQTLQRLFDQLPQPMFCRVHKSHVVSLNKFDFIEGNMIVVNGVKIPIGQTYRNDLLESLQKR